MNAYYIGLMMMMMIMLVYKRYVCLFVGESASQPTNQPTNQCPYVSRMYFYLRS